LLRGVEERYISARTFTRNKLRISALFYVYILKSLKDNNLYTGYTSDLKKRIKEHDYGNVDSTKNRLPLELIYYEAYKEKVQALMREKYPKTTRGKYQIKKQLNIE
jgi:putative endonuclease